MSTGGTFLCGSYRGWGGGLGRLANTNRNNWKNSRPHFPCEFRSFANSIGLSENILTFYKLNTFNAFLVDAKKKKEKTIKKTNYVLSVHRNK